MPVRWFDKDEAAAYTRATAGNVDGTSGSAPALSMPERDYRCNNAMIAHQGRPA
jgi:hypothetical protein